MPVSIRKDIALRVIPYYDRLISLQGDDPAARAGVAKTLLLRARLRHALGTTSEDHEAIADCLEAARLYAEAPPTPDNAFGRAQALASIGAILGPQRRFLEAIARLTVAQEILDGLVAAQPDRKDYRFQFAKCLSNEANCHRFLGQQHAAASPAGDAAREFRAAERAYSDAIGHVQQLVRRFPDEARFREWLARIWGNLGDLYLARSDLDEATRSAEAGRALQQGRQIAIALDREFPGVTSIQDCLVILSLNYGEYLKNGGRSAEAVAEYSRASLVYDRLHDRHPDQREFRWGQALARGSLGMALAESDAIAQRDRPSRRPLDSTTRWSPTIPRCSRSRPNEAPPMMRWPSSSSDPGRSPRRVGSSRGPSGSNWSSSPPSRGPTCRGKRSERCWPRRP